jgi:hypothetical protein
MCVDYIDISASALRTRFGNKVARKISNWFDQKEDSGDFCCMDNYRVALKGDALQEKDYEKRIDQGCCGFYDEEIVVRKLLFFKRTFLVGFNYGH